MSPLTMLLAFAVLMLVIIPVIVNAMPSSRLCTNEVECDKIRWRLQMASLFLIVVMVVTPFPAAYFIFKDMNRTEAEENPMVNNLLKVGLLAFVIVFGVITPWLAGINENLARYSGYPPKDECPLYWEKDGDQCRPISLFENSYTNKDVSTLSSSGIEQAKKSIQVDKTFWDGVYNGGFLV